MNEITKKYCAFKKHYVDKKLFYKRKGRTNDLQSYCIECTKENHELQKLKKKEGTIKAF